MYSALIALQLPQLHPLLWPVFWLAPMGEHLLCLASPCLREVEPLAMRSPQTWQVRPCALGLPWSLHRCEQNFLREFVLGASSPHHAQLMTGVSVFNLFPL